MFKVFAFAVLWYGERETFFPNSRRTSMGWLFTQGQTRKELIAHLTRTEENEHAKWVTLKKYCSGNDLWTVQEVRRKDGETSRFICLYMMKPSKDGWGYKDVEESCGPFQHTCPVSFLDMVPEPPRPEGYHNWRAAVRNYWATRNQKLKVGQEIRLTNGLEYRITSLRPLRGVNGYMTYRIPRRMLTMPEPSQEEMDKQSAEIEKQRQEGQ
jgi:hypothetical protein